MTGGFISFKYLRALTVYKQNYKAVSKWILWKTEYGYDGPIPSPWLQFTQRVSISAQAALDFKFQQWLQLRTEPANTEVFLRGSWLCGKRRS